MQDLPHAGCTLGNGMRPAQVSERSHFASAARPHHVLTCYVDKHHLLVGVPNLFEWQCAAILTVDARDTHVGGSLIVTYQHLSM